MAGETSAAWEERADAIDTDFAARCAAAGMDMREAPDTWPHPLRAELERSWTQIFDPHTWHVEATLQACVHELRAEQVVRVVRLP
jgi:hypothetical protein